MTSKIKKIIARNGLIISLIGIILICLSANLFSQEPSKSDIEKMIIGCWYGEEIVPQGYFIQIRNFYPNKITTSRGFIVFRDKKIIGETEEKYEIDGNKISYDVTKSSIPDKIPVGYATYDIVERITDDENIYLDKSGKRHTRKKVNPIYGWYVWHIRLMASSFGR